MKRKKLLLLLLLAPLLMQAQTHPPFWADIQQFHKQDSLHFPGTGKILFVGSSSFTKWTDVQDYFPQYPIINRGFGGSTLKDVIRYAPDVIFPYEPKQIIIYCGENDFAEDTSLYPAQVAQRFEELFTLIRSRFKKVPIVYISMKPSPSRAFLMPRFNVANVMIKSFLKTKKKTTFIDVYHAMLGTDGKPLPGIYIDDNLHMNAAGYKIWQKLIAPHLLK